MSARVKASTPHRVEGVGREVEVFGAATPDSGESEERADYQVMPPLSADDREALKADIAKRGSWAGILGER